MNHAWSRLFRSALGQNRRRKLSKRRLTRRPRGWRTAIAVALGCILVGALMLLATPLGRQVASALQFIGGWHDIARQQQQITRAIMMVVHELALPETAYQRTEAIPQRQGREHWQRYTHVIQVTPAIMLAQCETHFQTVMRRIGGMLLKRHEYRQPDHIRIELIFGVAGVPTDVVVLVQAIDPRPAPEQITTVPALPVQVATPAAAPVQVTTSAAASKQVAAMTLLPALPVVGALPPVRTAVQPPSVPPVLPKRLERSMKQTLPGVTLSQMAIVIDDLGWDLDAAQTLLAMGVPLSLAILPEAPYRTLIAQEAKRRGQDVLLHLPMEPHGSEHADLGPYVLRSTMSKNEMMAKVEAALAVLPSVVGVNNHMGSRLTEDRNAMHTVMQMIKHHKLFFLDSRTSKDSLAYEVAQKIGVPTAQRQIFLDNEADATKITQQLHHLATLAHEQGSAIGIGHPYPATLQALHHFLPTLRQAGIELVPVSRLVR